MFEFMWIIILGDFFKCFDKFILYIMLGYL